MEAAASASWGTSSSTSASSKSCKRSLSKKLSSSSFSLRCPSLNTLRLRRIFDLFDKNRDGTITGQELGQALNLLGLDVDMAELESTINSFVRPGNEGLMFEDFKALHQSLNDTYFGGDMDVEQEEEEADQEEEEEEMSQEDSDLTEAFKVFDEDGDGYISAHELQVVLGKLGFAEGNEIDRVEKMITSVDRNQDGRVDFFEFKDMMRSVLVRSA
ncbi:calcium-binding allergen Bet v 3 [Ziziphus jujuba]|uniref:Calcium-binding allergen Bet v 3 n=2 Tax=Ziziphus jujuba TaxID=326968 RepID=A0A6P4BFF1_ZIZJJ|nr:calcium-binding allergen Bet v 3 [Ziziphus jujuba]KAH7515140.1 hypothetical protein FEM48_Zijuj11G0164300 [Ziziphus jujuba var. spinosa]